MRRRDLILSACAVVMPLFGSAQAWSEESELGGQSKGTKPAKAAEDPNIFQDLANLFKEMRNILEPVADVETKRRFGVAFQGINENLKHISQAQDEIFRALEQDPCSASGESKEMRSASWQASQLTTLVLKLSEQVRNIGVTIRSAEVGEQAGRVATKLLSQEVNKYWSGDLFRFCQLGPAQQAAFLHELRLSQTAIQNASEDLSELITKLLV